MDREEEEKKEHISTIEFFFFVKMVEDHFLKYILKCAKENV